jgi:hypothetical protein
MLNLFIFQFLNHYLPNKVKFFYATVALKQRYGIYPTKFASSTQKHKKVIVTPNQPIHIKKFSNKKAKIRMGTTRRSVQAQLKILIKYQNTKSTNQDENFSKKKYA